MSTPKKKIEAKKEAFPLTEVSFYFDQVERDRMDALGTSSRTKEIMDIRSRLLTLPDGQFTATVRALQGIIEAKTDSSLDKSNGIGKKDQKSGPSPEEALTLEDQLTPATVTLLQSQHNNS